MMARNCGWLSGIDGMANPHLLAESRTPGLGWRRDGVLRKGLAELSLRGLFFKRASAPLKARRVVLFEPLNLAGCEPAVRPLACHFFSCSRTLALEPVERLGLLQVRWRMLRRRWRIDRHGRASRLDYGRFPPAKSLDAFVNDGQERRETCKQAEEKIQVGVVPTDFHFRSTEQ